MYMILTDCQFRSPRYHLCLLSPFLLLRVYRRCSRIRVPPRRQSSCLSRPLPRLLPIGPKIPRPSRTRGKDINMEEYSPGLSHHSLVTLNSRLGPLDDLLGYLRRQRGLGLYR